MTRAEIIAKLKEAKGPLSVEDSFKMTDFILAFMSVKDHYTDIMRALNSPHPISLAFAISLVEREKPGWVCHISTSKPAQACLVEPSIKDGYIPHKTVRGATPAIALVIALIGGE